MSAIKHTLAFAAKLAERGVLPATSKPGMMFSMSKYMKYGLMTDDLTRSNPVVEEALRRLPPDVFQERQWRLTRAIGANANKDVLAETDWLKPEEDVQYLKPMIQQVVDEIKEKEAWNAGKFE